MIMERFVKKNEEEEKRRRGEEEKRRGRVSVFRCNIIVNLTGLT